MTPLTRSEAQRQRRQRERLQRQQAAAQQTAGPSAGATQNMLIRGHTGLLYDVRSLNSSISQRIAARGLQSENFMVDISKKHEFIDASHYFAFQLREPASVRVFDPTGTSERRVSCSCEEFGEDPSTVVCAHIYWLYDGLSNVLGAIPADLVQPVDKSSVEQRLTQLYDAIGGSIDHLQDELNQTWDEASDDMDEMIQDMLAVFTADRVWDDFDEDFFSSIPEAEGLPFQKLVVPGNLATTVFALARHDPAFRDRLRNAVTKEICAEDFLRKLEAKRQTVFKRFDDYETRGPRFEAGFINACGSRLHRILSKISTYKHGARAPLSHDFDVESAKLALRTLSDVCERDKDIYGDSKWQTTEDDPEEDRDCNLFANLISDPPPGRRDDLFVLDLLAEDIPQPAWNDLVNELERLIEKFKDQKTPARYLNKLQELIHQSQASGQLFEEAEEQQSPATPADQWRHVVGLATSSSGANLGRERRPTMEEGPESQRPRLD